MSSEMHRKLAQAPVACAVVTVSDTRTEANDTSGQLLCDLLARAGHPVAAYTIVKDDPDAIRRLLEEYAARRCV